MFEIFTKLASLVVYELLQLPQGTKLADSLHFFIEGTTKIFAPLLVMIYLIALLRASLRVEKVRDFLAGKHRSFGYMHGSAFGAIAPFRSCSSIPVLLVAFTLVGWIVNGFHFSIQENVMKVIKVLGSGSIPHRDAIENWLKA